MSCVDYFDRGLMGLDLSSKPDQTAIRVRVAGKTFDVNQIVYALERQANALTQQADRLAAQQDYSAEFPAEDADRMREAIYLLCALITPTR